MTEDNFDSDKKLATRVDEHAEGLTSWEVGFVASCIQRLDTGRELSERQREILTRIDDERVR